MQRASEQGHTLGLHQSLRHPLFSKASNPSGSHLLKPVDMLYWQWYDLGIPKN